MGQLRAELAATPPRVRKHYIKTLLEWTTSTLLKAASVSGKGIDPCLTFRSQRALLFDSENSDTQLCQ